jgi:hypothetical protein
MFYNKSQYILFLVFFGVCWEFFGGWCVLFSLSLSVRIFFVAIVVPRVRWFFWKKEKAVVTCKLIEVTSYYIYSHLLTLLTEASSKFQPRTAT